MKSAIVSIDFDFFIRERMIWDWGHRESMLFYEAMWQHRYSSPSLNIYKDTDPEKYADFDPRDLRRKLLDCGLLLGEQTLVSVNDSHGGMVEFMRRVQQTDKRISYVFNIDAHHDLYYEPKGAPDCSNWWVHVVDKLPASRHIWLKPRWTEHTLAGGSIRPQVEEIEWRRLIGSSEPLNVVGLFMCRSSCWVPPHHDPLFNQMVSSIHPSKHLHLPVRQAPTYSEQQAMRREFIKQMRSFSKHGHPTLASLIQNRRLMNGG